MRRVTATITFRICWNAPAQHQWQPARKSEPMSLSNALWRWARTLGRSKASLLSLSAHLWCRCFPCLPDSGSAGTGSNAPNKQPCQSHARSSAATKPCLERADLLLSRCGHGGRFAFERRGTRWRPSPQRAHVFQAAPSIVQCAVFFRRRSRHFLHDIS